MDVDVVEDFPVGVQEVVYNPVTGEVEEVHEAPLIAQPEQDLPAVR